MFGFAIGKESVGGGFLANYQKWSYSYIIDISKFCDSFFIFECWIFGSRDVYAQPTFQMYFFFFMLKSYIGKFNFEQK